MSAHPDLQPAHALIPAPPALPLPVPAASPLRVVSFDLQTFKTHFCAGFFQGMNLMQLEGGKLQPRTQQTR